jgi:hypothetical protein
MRNVFASTNEVKTALLKFYPFIGISSLSTSKSDLKDTGCMSYWSILYDGVVVRLRMRRIHVWGKF